MKRRALNWIIGLFALMILIPVAALNYEKFVNELAFQEQLRLARNEGLATNAAEFAATIEPAKPEENAAPIYRELQGRFPANDNPTDLTNRLIYRLDTEALPEARHHVQLRSEIFAIVERASSRTRCWFDRDWSLGASVQMPEYRDMRLAARNLEMRAALNAHEGLTEEAIQDARRIFAIAEHAREEGTAISAGVSEGIYSIGTRLLAGLAFSNPKRSEYKAALARAIDQMHVPDVRREHRGDLLMALSAIDLSSSRQGRARLGIREIGRTAADSVIPNELGLGEARIAIVRALRKRYAALLLSGNKRAAKRDEGQKELLRALTAFPQAASLFANPEGQPIDARIAKRELFVEARKLQLRAFLRALQNGSIASSIESHDLRSPFDGKEIEYRFDGVQISIRVSGTDNALRVPSNRTLRR